MESYIIESAANIMAYRLGGTVVTQEQRDKSYADLCQALAKYRQVLERDLATGYNGHPRFNSEDVEFLAGTIDLVKRFQDQIGADQNTLPPE